MGLANQPPRNCMARSAASLFAIVPSLPSYQLMFNVIPTLPVSIKIARSIDKIWPLSVICSFLSQCSGYDWNSFRFTSLSSLEGIFVQPVGPGVSQQQVLTGFVRQCSWPVLSCFQEIRIDEFKLSTWYGFKECRAYLEHYHLSRILNRKVKSGIFLSWHGITLNNSRIYLCKLGTKVHSKWSKVWPEVDNMIGCSFRLIKV